MNFLSELYNSTWNYLFPENDDLQKDGWTPLMLASRYSNDLYFTNKSIQNLIDEEKDINAQNINGTTSLMLASLYSNEDSTLENVKELISAGADLNLQDEDGLTTLMFATRFSDMMSSNETVKCLIDAGLIQI